MQKYLGNVTSMRERSPSEKILALAKQRRIIRPRDLGKMPREHLLRLVRKGLIVRLGRGIYALPGDSSTEHHSLAVVAKQSPRSIVCLLSALRFHELTTQQPSEVWIAIANKSWVKDFFDIWILSQQQSFLMSRLRRAIVATFERRKTALPDGRPTALTDEFLADRAKVGAWKAFLKRVLLTEDFAEQKDVGEAIAAFLMPVVD